MRRKWLNNVDFDTIGNDDCEKNFASISLGRRRVVLEGRIEISLELTIYANDDERKEKYIFTQVLRLDRVIKKGIRCNELKGLANKDIHPVRGRIITLKACA